MQWARAYVTPEFIYVFHIRMSIYTLLSGMHHFSFHHLKRVCKPISHSATDLRGQRKAEYKWSQTTEKGKIKSVSARFKWPK